LHYLRAAATAAVPIAVMVVWNRQDAAAFVTRDHQIALAVIVFTACCSTNCGSSTEE